ncbi:MAG: hypothetical protein KIH65_004610, partial [Candidatus Uhrbacteria bacterium]|nr:hypothetical protein [Candidatus Uhrbacteria bacterium]
MFLGATRYNSLKKFIKTSILVVGILLVIVLPAGKDQIFAAQGINEQINYQGKLLTSAGVPVTSGTYSIRFSLYDAESAGNRVWTASGSVGSPSAINVSVAENGLFSILLGSGAQNSLDGVDWNSDSIYLGVTVGSDSEMTPRKRFGSAAQAFNTQSWNGYRTASSVTSGAEVLKLVQTGENAASSDRSTLLLSTSGTSDTYDYLIKAINASGAVFTVSRQGNVTTTGNLAVSGQTIIGDATSDVVTFNARIASNIVATTNNAFDLGSSALSWRNIYASGTIVGVDASFSDALTVGGLSSLQALTFTNATGTNVTSTNLYVSGITQLPSNTLVGGQLVCLANGTNCPVTGGSSDANWAWNSVTDVIRPVTSTNNVAIGGTSEGTSPFFFRVNATTSRLTIGPSGYAAEVVIGASTSSIANTAFQLTGDDLFVAGNIGSASSIYTNAALVAGSTSYANGVITNAGGEMVLNATGFAPSSNNITDLGSALNAWRNIYASGTIAGVDASFSNALTVSGLSSLQALTFTNATGTNVTSTNLYATLAGFASFISTSGTVSEFNFTNATGSRLAVTTLTVGGQSVCLANGTNCAVSGESDTLLSVTNRG